MKSTDAAFWKFWLLALRLTLQGRASRFFIGRCPRVSTFCLPHLNARGQISQAILQVIRDWTGGGDGLGMRPMCYSTVLPEWELHVAQVMPDRELTSHGQRRDSTASNEQRNSIASPTLQKLIEFWAGNHEQKNKAASHRVMFMVLAFMCVCVLPD